MVKIACRALVFHDVRHGADMIVPGEGLWGKSCFGRCAVPFPIKKPYRQ
jgi:hypothetical protein